jgi:NEDD8-activating enzyme E1 regulatory subunit
MAAPDESKAKRYDRQIRIWGADGQARLEAARVALLNCGPTGAETLKNLVLGGIASFTAVDAARVGARDLGNNFFVAPDSLGEPRAKVRARGCVPAARAQGRRPAAGRAPRAQRECRIMR